MKIARLTFLLAPILAALLLPGCGSGGGRQLQSITITPTVNGEQIQFVAAGHFSTAPTTVSPLPVDWTLGLMSPPPPSYSYTLTTQPYIFHCSNAGLYNLPVVAFAPPDPDAPSSGTTRVIVSASSAINCQ